MTSDALTIAIAVTPALSPSSSTASLVIEAVTIWPGAISRRTCAVVAPFFTSRILPLSLLRALSFMSDLAGWRRDRAAWCAFHVILHTICTRRRHACARVCNSYRTNDNGSLYRYWLIVFCRERRG